MTINLNLLRNTVLVAEAVDLAPTFFKSCIG